jgi:hypothetical protein
MSEEMLKRLQSARRRLLEMEADGFAPVGRREGHPEPSGVIENELFVRKMIEERIKAIQSTIETARNISSARKAELLELVAGLKSELRGLAETHSDQAASITRFADASAHEASRWRKNDQLAETALQGLRLFDLRTGRIAPDHRPNREPFCDGPFEHGTLKRST